MASFSSVMRLCNGEKVFPFLCRYTVDLAEWEKTAFIKWKKLCCISGTWMTYLASRSAQLNLLKNSWLCWTRIILKLNSNTIYNMIRLIFLDTTVPLFFFCSYTENTKRLATKVYFKNTDGHAVLHKTSYHPKHIFRGLIKSQMIRFNHIRTHPQDVEEATKVLFRHSDLEGYTRQFLREIKADIRAILRERGEYSGGKRGEGRDKPSHLSHWWWHTLNNSRSSVPRLSTVSNGHRKKWNLFKTTVWLRQLEEIEIWQTYWFILLLINRSNSQTNSFSKFLPSQLIGRIVWFFSGDRADLKCQCSVGWPSLLLYL